jgi:hypothetical protein
MGYSELWEAGFVVLHTSRLHRSRVLAGEASGELLNLVFRYLLGFLQFGENREFRANQGTKTAVNAVVGLKYKFRRMIALCVETLALLQTPVRAEFDTKAATLASTLDDMHHSLRYGMGFGIQWQSPKLHTLILLYANTKTELV